MTAQFPEWDGLRRIADEVELKIHLASMEARDRWKTLQPRLAELEKTLTHAGERTGQVVTEELSALAEALRELREDVTRH
jgi:hypothetical protein